MDYIRSWYEYFRGYMGNGSKQDKVDVLKNEFLKLDDSDPPEADNSLRYKRNIEANSDIMSIFFGHSGQSDRPEISSGTVNFWPFYGDMFHSANEVHNEFLNLINEFQNELSLMQGFIFQDGPNQNLDECLHCDRPPAGESLRDYYLRVPDLESVKSEDKCNKFSILNPGQDTNRMIRGKDVSSTSMPYLHQTQQMVSVAVGPDGVLEITKIVKDSNGKTEKTVTKVDLRDKL